MQGGFATRAWALLAALAAALVAACPAAAVSPVGLPAGAAAAALRPEPSLPVPAGWPFPDAFSRTSGTGRMIGGAFEWTDWVYDDYGASSPQGLPLNTITSSADALSPAQGEYVYPTGAADGDGADIFRAAVGLSRRPRSGGSTGTRSPTRTRRSPSGRSTPTTTR